MRDETQQNDTSPETPKSRIAPEYNGSAQLGHFADDQRYAPRPEQLQSTHEIQPTAEATPEHRAPHYEPVANDGRIERPDTVQPRLQHHEAERRETDFDRQLRLVIASRGEGIERVRGQDLRVETSYNPEQPVSYVNDLTQADMDLAA